MAKGNSKIGEGAKGRFSGGGGLDPADILNTTDMISARNVDNQKAVDEMLTTSQEVGKMFGVDSTQVLDQFLIAELAPKAQDAMGYYDGANIGINTTFMNEKIINKAYADSVKSGFHPSNGNKTALQAVGAHEYGHAMTDVVGRKMGINNIDVASQRIVNEARKAQGKHRGVVQFGNAISRYASASNAETVAEAVSDVYCNGRRAKAESKAVVKVMKNYLKG